MGRLTKKVIRWFNGNKDLACFQYRFTGQDSHLFLQNFMFIIDSIKQAHDSEKQTFPSMSLRTWHCNWGKLSPCFVELSLFLGKTLQSLNNAAPISSDAAACSAQWPQQPGLWSHHSCPCIWGFSEIQLRLKCSVYGGPRSQACGNSKVQPKYQSSCKVDADFSAWICSPYLAQRKGLWGRGYF